MKSAALGDSASFCFLCLSFLLSLFFLCYLLLWLFIFLSSFKKWGMLHTDFKSLIFQQTIIQETMDQWCHPLYVHDVGTQHAVRGLFSRISCERWTCLSHMHIESALQCLNETPLQSSRQVSNRHLDRLLRNRLFHANDWLLHKLYIHCWKMCVVYWDLILFSKQPACLTLLYSLFRSISHIW